MTNKERQIYDKKRYQEHKEDIKIYNKKFYIEHKKEIKEKVKKYNLKHKDKIKKYYQNNKVKIRVCSRKYYYKHKEEAKAYIKQWREENIEKSRAIQRKVNKKRLSTPKGKLDHTMSTSIYLVLKRNKASKKWESLVGYTLEDLMKHLENLFDDKMNWNNYGSYWWIDHIKPKSLFHYETAEDPEFKKCWALSNLQPLEKIANIKKSNHYPLDFRLKV